MLIQQLLNRLKGKTVWITGGKRVGQTVAKALAELGVNVLVSYRGSKEEADEIVSQAKKLKVKALAVQADVSKKEDVQRAVEAGEKELGGIDYLVQMASVFSAKPFENITEEDWDKNIDAHIKGSFWPAQVLAEKWKAENRKGKMVLFTDRTSLESGHPYLNHLPYIITKGAVQTMVKTLAKELGKYGILVNSIAPGPLLRPPTISEKEWQEIRDSALISGLTDEESINQVALTVVYLLLSELTTGQAILLDSGFNLN